MARVDEINTQAQVQLPQEMVNKYSDVFNDLGLIKSNTKIHINEEIPPVIDTPRRIPIAIANYIYNTKWWFSLRVALITTPLLLNAANMHNPPPLMLHQAWVVNRIFILYLPYTFHIDFASFDHLNQSGVYF